VTGPLTHAFLYDNNGNLTKKCEGTGVTKTATDCSGSIITQLWYNTLDQLTQMTKTGLPLERYIYDDQGRRIQKTVGGAIINYLYNGPDVYAEYTGNWTTANAYYVHGPNMDDPISRTSGSTTQYYHQDGLGSVVALSGSAGTTDATRRYDAWGNVLASTGTLPAFGYTGREPDASGLVYYRARYYDPSTGRFTQRDPSGFNGGINQYAYVNGNPTNFVDPWGLAAQGPSVNNISSYCFSCAGTSFNQGVSQTLQDFSTGYNQEPSSRSVFDYPSPAQSAGALVRDVADAWNFGFQQELDNLAPKIPGTDIRFAGFGMGIRSGGGALFDPAMAKLPVNTGGKTSGMLHIPDQPSVPLQSGISGPSQAVRGQGLPGFNGNQLTHVEGHAAAYMRTNNISRAVLDINKAPCTQGSGGGCNGLLPRMLPPGSSLTVRYPDGVRTYTGGPD
jgi:RHS repeat-associated protein